MVDGARGPSGNNRSGAFGTATIGHLRPNSRLTSSRTYKAGHRDQATIPYCGAKQMICGVDVSSKSLDARIGRDGAAACFTNNPKGIAELAEFCQCHKVHLVAMEATGGDEKKPFALLWAAGIQVAVVKPRAGPNFAQGMGFFEKPDRIDAGVIAWYAQTKPCVAVRPASAQQQQLRAMVTRLRQLTELRAAQRNQRLLASDKVEIGR